MAQSPTNPRDLRAASLLLIGGVVLYILPTVLHGNPPIDDATATLQYVSERGLWTVAHFANIAAIVAWVAAVALLWASGFLARGRGAIASAVWSVAGSAFAIYFGIHAVGLWAASEQLAHQPATVVAERTEAVLLVLGSGAFVAQGLVGTAVALLGAAIASSDAWSRALGVVGVVAGAGWAVGALLLNFAVIVPFTALTWAWIVALAATLLKRAGKASTTVAAQPV